MTGRLSIAICGAGPAGLAAALALSRSGHRVSLFDQFETPKPLGSGLMLQPTGLAVLDWLGLGVRMRGLGARIDRLLGKAITSGRVVLDVRYADLGAARGLGVHRAGLFNVLFEAVSAAGINFESSCRISGLEAGVVMLNQGRRAGPFDLVVDGLGSRSPLIPLAAAQDRRRPLGYGALWASLPWPGVAFDPNALEQRYDRASVMIGVLPIGRQREELAAQAAFFWSLKADDYPRWREGGLVRWKTEVHRLWPTVAPLLDAIASPGQMIFASYDHHTLPRPYGRKLVFVGDSAHSTSPQLGQGANMALLDVWALATALEENGDLDAAIMAYVNMRRFHVKLYQTLSWMFTPFYQSDSHGLPLIRDRVVAPLSRIGPARRLLASIVSGRFGRPREPGA